MNAKAWIGGLLLTALLLAGCNAGGDSQSSSQQDGSQQQSGQEGSTTMTTLPQFQPAKGEVATIHTTMGDIKVMFFPEEAPKAVENWLTHAKEGYYDGVIFHRVISEFMIQTGDPLGTGMGGESIWGEGFGDEYSENLYHFRGALCMAKSSLPNSIGSQFYIVQGYDIDESLHQKLLDGGWPQEVADQYAQVGGFPSLDRKYTVFGQVIEGLDVVKAISEVKTDANDKPLSEIKINSITVETVD